MILVYETDAIPQFVKDMHEAAITGLGIDTKTDDAVAVRKFAITDDDRCQYEELAEADVVFLTYRRKRGYK